MMMDPFFDFGDPFFGMLEEESRRMDAMMRQQRRMMEDERRYHYSMMRKMELMEDVASFDRRTNTNDNYPMNNDAPKRGVQSILEEATDLLRDEFGGSITVGPVVSQSSSSSYVSSVDSLGRPIKESRSILQLNVQIHQSPPPWQGVKLQVENNRLRKLVLQSNDGQTKEIPVPFADDGRPFRTAAAVGDAIIDAEIVVPGEEEEQQQQRAEWNDSGSGSLEGEQNSGDDDDDMSWDNSNQWNSQDEESWNYNNGYNYNYEKQGDGDNDWNGYNEGGDGETWNGYSEQDASWSGYNDEGEQDGSTWNPEASGDSSSSWNTNEEEEESSSEWNATNEVY